MSLVVKKFQVRPGALFAVKNNKYVPRASLYEYDLTDKHLRTVRPLNDDSLLLVMSGGEVLHDNSETETWYFTVWSLEHQVFGVIADYDLRSMRVIIDTEKMVR